MPKSTMQEVYEMIDKLIYAARYASTTEEKKAKAELVRFVREHIRDK